MGMSQKRAGVAYKEGDFTQIISQESTSIAVNMGASKKGRAGLFTTTSYEAFVEEYGLADPTISFFHYMAMTFYEKGGKHLVNQRVIGTNADYGGLVLQKKSGDPSPTLRTATFGDPDTVDLSTVGTASAIDDNIFLIYPRRGPGSYSSNWKLQVISDNLTTPTGLVVTLAATPGTLPAATYSYRIVALNSASETVGCAAVSLVVASGTTNALKLVWTAVARATSYKIYGRTGGTEKYMTTVGAGLTEFIDLGTITPHATTVPLTTAVFTNDFTLQYYDISKQATPLEILNCSFDRKLGGDGLQAYFEDKINQMSQYLEVVSNTAAHVAALPDLFSIASTTFGVGDSGDAVTDSQVALAWSDVKDKERISVKIFINGGYTTPTVQLAMDTVAKLRGDAISILDMPSGSQTVQSAIDYRNATLNLNSDRAAIYTPDVLYADTVNGKSLYIPPSGFVAGTFALTDYTRQPWFQPAGLNRGLLNVLGLRAIYNETDQEILASAQINYMRNFPGQGIAIWEGLTMQGQQSARSWIAIRRLLDTLRTSISKFALYSVHEPNDDITVRALVRPIEDYLAWVKSQRGISNFAVISDTRNNPGIVLDSGQRNLDIYIQPVLPIGVIQLGALLSRQGVDAFKELVSSQIQL